MLPYDLSNGPPLQISTQRDYRSTSMASTVGIGEQVSMSGENALALLFPNPP